MKHSCACGAIYELTEHSIIQRDKDSIECQFCGRELIHWNGGCVWSSNLINVPPVNGSADDNNHKDA